jgi:nitrogen regulatory protein P-II 1
MQKVEAFIKSHRLDELVQVIQQINGVTGMSVTDALGFGRGRPDGGRELSKNTKIEVFCKDDLVDMVVAAIEKAAHTGLRSDGKIYVIPVGGAVRISTGRRGADAV